ncbi:MAG TPA: phosphoribosyltransferase, partial [Nitrososphaeria archaeon]|nr:phosphoribosyltransferase [Nitrososphaeria archaeon]
MIFRDRLDAGERLAGLLSDYEGERTAVIAIPRGGVEVGYVVASKLSSP